MDYWWVYKEHKKESLSEMAKQACRDREGSWDYHKFLHAKREEMRRAVRKVEKIQKEVRYPPAKSLTT